MNKHFKLDLRQPRGAVPLRDQTRSQVKCKTSDRYGARAMLLASLLSGAIGCGVTDVDAPNSEPATLARVESAASTPTLIASLKLKSGHVLEFYDFGQAVLITEAGAAYTSPALNSAGSTSADQLTDIWTRLAPEVPVPAALQDLQRRLTSLPADSSESEIAPSSNSGGARIASLGTARPSAQVGCNNGCCDATWLLTLGECQGTGWDFSWFLYNYGWSSANSTHIGFYDGLVCSAQGTSTYSVDIGGSGGTWSVPEATYRWFRWWELSPFGWGARNSSSSVNSPSDQHLHTYCGVVAYD
jgi:hypothetical protein